MESREDRKDVDLARSGIGRSAYVIARGSRKFDPSGVDRSSRYHALVGTGPTTEPDVVVGSWRPGSGCPDCLSEVDLTTRTRLRQRSAA